MGDITAQPVLTAFPMFKREQYDHHLSLSLSRTQPWKDRTCFIQKKSLSIITDVGQRSLGILLRSINREVLWPATSRICGMIHFT